MEINDLEKEDSWQEGLNSKRNNHDRDRWNEFQLSARGEDLIGKDAEQL